jgi:hypothetical protein
MNHTCQFLIERGKRKGKPCRRDALLYKDKMHVCRPHFDILKNRERLELYE